VKPREILIRQGNRIQIRFRRRRGTGKCEVDHRTNEITQVRPLLEPLPLAGAVIAPDAIHCQRETARYLAEDK
jgi:hypothetical protein